LLKNLINRLVWWIYSLWSPNWCYSLVFQRSREY